MKHSERFALKHFFESFPENKTMEEIFQLFKDPENDSIVVNELYIDGEDDDFFIQKIIEMVDEIDKQFFPFHELITIIDKDTIRDLLTTELGREPIEDEVSRVCSYLDDDFSATLVEKVLNALKDLQINK